VDIFLHSAGEELMSFSKEFVQLIALFLRQLTLRISESICIEFLVL
jgi:hypothetical protein